ncbi:phage holin family protein [Janibacter limosus]|jgi:putative membrane protein|uniref:Phage holin family protein n=1 Tax=Janibacter limosus TaxID=53458 RepID=A0A4P6MUK2_9MICO|nr:phage holin family protein [Janibacter limosus]QBF44933.1 phage holin family protein [Janibacter limosus]
MTNFLIRTGVNAVALWVAAWLIDGIVLAEDDTTFASKFATVILVALIFGVVNAIVKPIAKVLAFPAIVLTLGLFTFVVNAFLLQITEWISGPLGLSFEITKFWWDAVIGALVITIVSMILNWVLPEKEDLDR